MRQNVPLFSKVKTLQLVTMAQCTGTILFLAVTLFLNWDKEWTTEPVMDKDKTLFYIAVVFAAAAIAFSSVIFNSMVAKIDLNTNDSTKLNQYSAAYIVRYAILEGGALLNIVAFLLSGCIVNAGIAAIIIIIMLFAKPKLTAVMENLRISYPDTWDNL